MNNLTHKKIYIKTATFVLIFLIISTIFTPDLINKPIGYLFKIIHQCLFGASLGIVAVFTLNAKLPKQYQLLKIIVAVGMFLFALVSITDFITENALSLCSTLEIYSSFYFLSLFYLWGINKINKESYEKLLEYKKILLYPAILYIFIISNLFLALHSKYS